MIDVKINEMDKVVILELIGEFDLDSISTVEKKWQVVVENNPEVIGINCKNLQFIDSSAIGTLVKFLNGATSRGINLVFYDLNKSISAIFKTARLDNFFTITTKEEFEKKYLHK